MNVAAHEPWRMALGEELVQGGHGGVGIDPPLDGARASRVNSSTTVSSFKILPSVVWSNW
jgi:hypothetical protein